MFRMVILGAPGSGKGTISGWIIKDFALKHLSFGDILRSHVNNRTCVGEEVEKYLRTGQLAPDKLMTKLMSDEVTNLATIPWLLDGYPRTLIQAEDLCSITKVNLVLSMEVPNSVIIQRIKDRLVHLPSGRIYNTLFNPPKVQGKDDLTGEPLVQRQDDLPEAVSRRLQIYSQNTNPIKDYYKELKLLKEFHGTESSEIYPRVRAFLQTLIPIDSRRKFQ